MSTSAGTMYYYEVSAVNGAGMEGGLSNEASAVTGDDVPSAPVGLHGLGGDGQAILEWSANVEPDVVGYHVYRSGTSGGPWVRLTTVAVSSSWYTDDGLVNGVSYYYVVTAMDAGGNESGHSAEEEVVPAEVMSSLVCHWSFDEFSGEVVFDSSGGGHHGTVMSGVIRVAGHVGGALSFDGVDDYVLIDSDLNEWLGGSSTLCAWLLTTAVGHNTNWRAPGLTGVEQAGGEDDVFWGWLDGSGRICVGAGDIGSATSVGSINDGSWHHVGFTRDSLTGRVSVYVDGVLHNSSLSESGQKGTPFSSLGRIEDTGGSPAYYAGLLDEVRIYDVVLSASEIASLATGLALDETAPVGPTDLSATAVGQSVVLSWTAASDLDSGILLYRLYRDTVSGTGKSLLGELNGLQTSFLDAGTVIDTTYYYEVAAVNGAGLEGAMSNEASATATAGAVSYTHFETGPAEPVLTGEIGSWDGHIREKVCVLHDDGIFKMWYAGSKVGYATSPDGIVWTKHPANPVIDRPSQDQDICVVKSHDTSYHMYVEVDDSFIDLFTSADGIHWIAYDGNPVKSHAASPVVWREGPDWYMLYEEMTGYPSVPAPIHLATSNDGRVWIDSPANPVLAESSHSVPDSVVKEGSTYHLYYHRYYGSWPTCHATSTDLLNWSNREIIMWEYSSQYTIRLDNGEVWAYIWYEQGDQNYYLRYGLEPSSSASAREIAADKGHIETVRGSRALGGGPRDRVGVGGGSSRTGSGKKVFNGSGVKSVKGPLQGSLE